MSGIGYELLGLREIKGLFPKLTLNAPLNPLHFPKLSQTFKP
jgi:hypothetical protein